MCLLGVNRISMERSTEYLRETLRKVDEEQKGLAVCPWCATPTNSDTESKTKHQLECAKSPLVIRLRELEQQAARVRGETIEECAKISDEWAAQYPVDIWPEDGKSRDCIAASMGRHNGKRIAERIRALAPAAGGDAK